MEPNQDSKKELLNLITWKRHEQPPPGYFSNFSGQVIQRLESGEAGAPTGLWQMVVDLLETKPVLAGAYSIGLCSMLLMGISTSQSLLQNSKNVPEPLSHSPFLPDLVLVDDSYLRRPILPASSMNPVFPSDQFRFTDPNNSSLIQPVKY